MANHFTPKSIAFYGIAIASVMTLFTVATTYGEAHLKAPRKIEGRYPLAATGLPGCLNAQPVVLMIQQSGIYLNGSLLPQEASEKVIRVAEERPLLLGQWNNQRFSLGGSTGYVPGCQEAVSLEGVIDQDQLQGSLKLGANGTAIAISAQREAPTAKSKEH